MACIRRDSLKFIDVEVRINLVRNMHSKDVLHVYDETSARLGGVNTCQLSVRARSAQTYWVEDRGAIPEPLVPGLEASQNSFDHFDIVS